MPKTKFHQSGGELYGDVTISGSISGAWQPGYLGNNEYIAIPPGDFILNQVDKTARNQIRAGELGTSLTNGGTLICPRGNEDTFGPLADDNALYALKIIPKGFRAYAAIVHGVDTAVPAAPSDWQALTSTIIDGGSAASLMLVTGINIQTTFSSKIVGDGLSYVILAWTRGDLLLSSLLGAQIFIEPNI